MIIFFDNSYLKSYLEISILLRKRLDFHFVFCSDMPIIVPNYRQHVKYIFAVTHPNANLEPMQLDFQYRTRTNESTSQRMWLHKFSWN